MKEAGDCRTRDDFENHTKAIGEAMGASDFRFFKTMTNCLSATYVPHSLAHGQFVWGREGEREREGRRTYMRVYCVAFREK